MVQFVAARALLWKMWINRKAKGGPVYGEKSTHLSPRCGLWPSFRVMGFRDIETVCSAPSAGDDTIPLAMTP